MNKKVVCIDGRYIFPQMDGIGRYLYNLIDSLSLLIEDSNEISLQVLEIEKFREHSILRKLKERRNIRFVSLPVYPQSIKNHFLNNWLKQDSFDVYHYPQFDLPWFIDKPTITTIHDMNPQMYPGFFGGGGNDIKKYYSIMANYVALKRSAKTIAISESTKTELLNLYGGKYKDSIEVIHSGIEDRFNKALGQSDSVSLLSKLKKQYKLDTYLLYVGNNRPHKNLENMIEAFYMLKKEQKINHKLLLIGKHLQGRFMNVEELKKKI